MANAAGRITALSISPVKALRVERRERLLLEPGGARGDRAMFLIDERGRMVNGKHHPQLTAVVAQAGPNGTLSLELPDGRRVEQEAGLGEELKVRFYSKSRPARAIEGPFSEVLSAYAGAPLRLVAFADGASAIDRGAAGAVTLMSAASAEAVARAAGREAIDARRFRMTIEFDGVAAFAEAAWIGRELTVGAARIKPFGHVGRCSITTLDPERGLVDLPTLDILREIRGGAETTEPLALGVFCAVTTPGEVAVGDELRVVD
ncbi:MAG TPA: MOSC N-terminal beta barrel domain-containing protein [Solirubrobacteraceae bacterium]|nr:MOSC N-terminal beta barrel domain-containing protein [Solirubrobacteraceae bacterium]